MNITKPILRVMLLPALLLVCAVAALGDVPVTKITIHVTTQTGRPIEHAEVVVNFVQGRWVGKVGTKMRKSYNLRTNQEGEARIPSIPQGDIKIMVHAKGYQTFGDVVTIEVEEKTVEVKLNPPQPQYSAH
jgi:hypothetical protein